MPHYVLDARTATPHFPGIGRYVSNLARAMVPLLDPDERLTLIHDPAHPLNLPPSPAVERGAAGALTLLAGQPVEGAAAPAPAGRRSLPQPVHRDALPAGRARTAHRLRPDPAALPAHSTARARLFARWMTRLALRAVRHTIAISDFTRRDFMAEFRLAPERITAIPLAADPAFCPQPPEVIAGVRARYGLPETFALYLGSNKPHKNLVRLVEAWRMANGRTPALAPERSTGASVGESANSTLVIAGAWDARYPEAWQVADAAVAKVPATGSPHQSPIPDPRSPLWLGPVPEPDLPALYAAATVFVFPSLYEGFGLPVLEAMACGTPVVCSNTSSLPQVAGDAAVTVDPLDTAALAAALTRVLEDAGLRSALRARGMTQAQRFSWTDTARRTLDLYRTLVTD